MMFQFSKGNNDSFQWLTQIKTQTNQTKPLSPLKKTTKTKQTKPTKPKPQTLNAQKQQTQIPTNKCVKEVRVRAGSHLQVKHAAHRNRNQVLGQ